MSQPTPFPHTSPAPASHAGPPAQKAIVFIEADVADYQSLLATRPAGTEVHVLNAHDDGLAVMAEVLDGRSGIDALHIISHGKAGTVSLGSLQLDSDMLPAYAYQLATIRSALNPGADVLLYGCNIGAGTTGAKFVDALSKATGADVAASFDLTGAAALGGNWKLEVSTGHITAPQLIDATLAADYHALLANFSGLQTFGGSTPENVTANGLFKVSYFDGSGRNLGVVTDDSGAYANDPNPAGFVFTSYIEVKLVAPGSFKLSGISAGDFDENGNSHTINFSNIHVVGLANDKIVYTTPGISSPNYAEEYNLSLGANTGTLIDTFRLYFTGDADDMPNTFNLTNFTVADGSSTPVSSAPDKPGTPDLAANRDSGFPADNYTNTNILDLSGTSEIGDTTSTVRVFVDANKNGVYDAGSDVTGAATVNNGSWTVNNINVAGLADGKYNVYAQITASGGSLSSELSDALEITLDRAAPTVTSITRAQPITGATNATSVTYTVTFSESVTGLSATSFDLFPVGNVTGMVTNVSGNGATWTVTVGNITGDGTLRLDLKNSGTGIVDTAGNAISGGFTSGQTYTFDHTAPAVSSIVRATPVSGATNLGSVDFTVTFTEEVSGVNLTDFALTPTGSATGQISNIVPADDGRTYTVTVNNISGDGTLRLDLKNAGTGIQDGAGNAASGYTGGQAYDIDRVAPDISSVTVPASATYRAGEQLEFTVHFDGAVTVDTTGGTPFIALTLDTGGVVRASYVGGTGTSALTFSYTVVAGNADANGIIAANAITLDGGTLLDTAGNEANLALDLLPPLSGVLVNALAPTVTSIVRSGDELTNATSVTFTVTFSETVIGVDASDFTLASPDGVSGTIGPVSGSGATWTVTVTDVTGNGALRLDLNASGTGIVGSSGQALAGGYSAGQSYIVDHVAPYLSSAIEISDTALKADETATVTFRFNEAVKDFTEADVTVSNGVLSGLSTADGGKTWTATLEPDAGVASGGNVLTLNFAGFTDLAGNASTGSVTSDSYAIDTERPHLASPIAIDDTALTIGDTATVTFTFNEAVIGFDIADVTVPGGKLSNLATFDGGKTWTATLAPADDTDHKTGNTMTLDYTGIADLAGNTGSGTATSVSYDVDTVRPGLLSDIQISSTTLTSGNSATVTFTFTEAVTGFTEDDVTVDNATLSNLASVDGITWTATLAAQPGQNDPSNILELDLSGITDLAGNIGVGTASSDNYAVDTTTPALAGPIAISETSLALNGTATVTFVFTDPVIGFTVEDVTVPYGKLEDLRTSDNITWHATLTPDGGTTSAGNVLTLDYTKITNNAGNAGVGIGTSVSYDVDTVRPVALDIEISDTTLTSGETATVTFTFSEAVTGFVIGNVEVGNGTLSNLDSSDGGKTWTATLTPPTGTTESTNKLTLHYAGINDLAGNAAIGDFESGNYAVDTTAPALAQPIGIDDTALRIGETATVTFVFDQAVTGFTAANVTVPNGTLSEPTSDDGITWTAILTPTPGATAASNVLTLHYAGIVTGAGNAGTGSESSGPYAVDTRAPTATVTLSDLDLRAGETAKVTIAFNEIVFGFDDSAVTAPNGTLGQFTTADGGQTWTATFTPNANTNVASNVISISLAGVTDAAGNAGSGSAPSPAYAVQTTSPPANPNPPTNPPAPDTIDGVKVEVETLPIDPATGVPGKAVTVPIVTGTRPDDPNTPNGDLADIPLGLGTGNGPRTSLLVSLPVGTGMRAEGPSSLLNNQQALLDLIRRIENQTEEGSSAQQGMTGNGTGFLGSLAPDTLLQSQTLVLTSAPGLGAPQTILVNGSSTTPPNGGQNATAIGLVIDTTGLPAGSTLQLNNVDFAAIVGAATVRGGEGRNFVTGDDSAQNIFLGADDDVLLGGGGNDIIGSAGGNDLLDGGSGDDILVGGIGDDRLAGGSGNNVLQGGRSSQGEWEFYLDASGTLKARHETALFAPGEHEDLALDELDAGSSELAFLGADKGMLTSLSLLYHAAFGRAPDLGGLSFWALGEVSVETAAAEFLKSAEWQAAGGGDLSDAAFIETLYQNVFGRAPDSGGQAFWTAQLAGSAGGAAMSRAEVLVAVSQSDEHKLAWNTADGYLIGAAMVGGENGWIADDGIDTAVYAGKTADYKFIIDADGRLKVQDKASGDLDQLFGIDLGEFGDGTLDLGFLKDELATVKQLGLLYQTVLDRAGDLGGFQWWLGRGIDGARLVQDFIATDEFKARYDGVSDAAFVQALYDNTGLDAGAAGGKASWESYLASHTRAELIATWLTQDGVLDAQFAGSGLWVV